MKETDINGQYWSGRWQKGETQWDLRGVSTPLKAYIDQLTNIKMDILVPGAGNAYEGIYLIEKGFTRTDILDIAPEPLNNIRIQYKGHYDNWLLEGDFFAHEGQYDLILEQTFFCALHPSLRPQYVQQCHKLLKPGGKIAGVLFNDVLNSEFPPFGGDAAEYRNLFAPLFGVYMEPCYNSIKPRADRELFVKFVKK